MKRFLVLTLVWILAEIVAVYGYSLVWLSESLPQNANSSAHKLVAWGCILLGVVAFGLYLRLLLRGAKPDNPKE